MFVLVVNIDSHKVFCIHEAGVHHYLHMMPFNKKCACIFKKLYNNHLYGMSKDFMEG